VLSQSSSCCCGRPGRRCARSARRHRTAAKRSCTAARAESIAGDEALSGARRDLGHLSRERKPETRIIEGTARRGPGTAWPGRLSRTEGQAMHIRWRTRAYERTCDDCGHVWRVPKWAAPEPVNLKGRPASGGCEGGARPPLAAALFPDPVVTATGQLAERAAVFRRCRECGSERYKQRSIWFWTDDPRGQSGSKPGGE